MLTISELTKRDIKAAIDKFEKSVLTMGWEQMPVSAISRKYVRLILDKSIAKDFSGSFNEPPFVFLPIV